MKKKNPYFSMAWLSRNYVVILVYVFLAIELTVGRIANPFFLSRMNIGNILEQSMGPLIIAIGQAFVILTGGIDLAVGSAVSLACCFISVIATNSMGSAVGCMLAVIAIGALAGLGAGLGVAKLRIPPFAMTLAMASVLYGLALQCRPSPGGLIPQPLITLFIKRLFGVVPGGVVIAALLYAAAIFTLSRLRYGRKVYAIGGNAVTSEHSGINVGRITISVYVICGVLSAVGGTAMATRLGTGDVSIGEACQMDSVAACILGGINLFGGRGNLVGVIGAVFIISIMKNVLNLAGVSSYSQYMIKGMILLAIVCVYTYKELRTAK